MRNTDPNWDWNGPLIPDHKPFFEALLVGKDGRIWVMLSTEGQPAENENHDPDDPSSQPVTWREPVRHDVFEPDGTYLGVVNPPDEFSNLPIPVFDGDHVWAVTRDELGVERVIRYRIVVGGGPTQRLARSKVREEPAFAHHPFGERRHGQDPGIGAHGFANGAGVRHGEGHGQEDHVRCQERRRDGQPRLLAPSFIPAPACPAARRGRRRRWSAPT